MNPMRIFKISLLSLFIVGNTALTHADFTQDHLIVINSPSAMSAGMDSLIELMPDGTHSQVLVPQSNNITGMSRTVYDPVSDHIFYSISSWPNQIFEVREIDSSGNWIATHAHPEFSSGNISMIMDQAGNLFIANNGRIFVKRSGQADIIVLFVLPYTGVGDLETDQEGNLFLSDPFICDCIYKISPDGSTTTFADPSDGLDSPYGLAVSPSGDLYVGNYTSYGPSIIKVTPDGTSSTFSTQNVRQGVIEMTFGPDLRLYAANREYDTIHVFEADGGSTLFADKTDGLNVPSSMTFITAHSTCPTDADADADNDVDGVDLAAFAINFEDSCIESFAIAFGRKGEQ